jgi:hypothetical protein
MKAYLTYPVFHGDTPPFFFLPVVTQALQKIDIESFTSKRGEIPEETFKRYLNELDKCDLLIAEVSKASHWVGIKIGLSYSLGITRILFHQKGSFVTKLVRGMPDTYVVEYALEDIEPLLLKVLREIKILK